MNLQAKKEPVQDLPTPGFDAVMTSVEERYVRMGAHLFDNGAHLRFPVFWWSWKRGQQCGLAKAKP